MAQSDVAPASVKQPVRFVDLTNQHTLAKSELQTAILRVLNSQQFILGSEVEQCEPYLIHQINLIKPRLIVALGRVAAKTLLKKDLPLKDMRSIRHNYQGTPLVATYHPAALLRNQNLKPAVWEDFKWIRRIIGESK